MAGITHRTRIATCLSVALALAGAVGCSEGKVRPGNDDGASGGDNDGDDTTTAGDGKTGADGKQVSCPENAPRAVNRVRVYPAAGKADQLVGVMVQGSNTGPTNDFVTLATIDAKPADGQFTEIKLDNDKLYRWVKLYASEPNKGAVAEIELYHDDVRVQGKPFGTVPSGDAAGGFAAALDGKTDTAFDGSTTGSNYAGLDVGGDAIAATPTFTPAPGNFDQAPEVTIASSTSGALIRYTTDGSSPTRDHGTVYQKPFVPDGRANIKAVAYADCLFESGIASGSYGVGGEKITRGLKTYHLGNSLTDTINHWLKPIADSTGVEHQFARWTIPGAPIRWLYEHQGQGFGEPLESGAENISTFAPKFAPIDHITFQPFVASINNEGDAAVELLKFVLPTSPDVQVWIYSQWPVRDMPGKPDNWKTSSIAIGAPWADPPYTAPHPPSNWEEATLSHEDFHHEVAKRVDDQIPGKAVKVMPGGRAMVLLKQAADKGQVPGLTGANFFDEIYEAGDDIHLSIKGQYLVSLVFYGAFYQQSPEGRVTHAGTDLTDAQALIYQRLAWQAVKDSGL